MEYKKLVTVSKQGGTCINIPKDVCRLFSIQPGMKLELSIDFKSETIVLRRQEC